MKIKKLFLLIASLLFLISLSSCGGKSLRNTTVPMGSINTSSIVASSHEFELTNGDYYSLLRSKGYDSFFAELQKALFWEEYQTVKSEVNLTDAVTTDTEQAIFDTVASALYGSSSAKTVEKLSEKEKNTKIRQYMDTNYNSGIVITEEQCKNYTTSDDKLQFKSLPDALIENQLSSLALNKAAENKLQTIVNQEKIEDENGNLVSNSRYISDENIQDYYESNMRDYGTYQAIIIQFNNLTEANNAVKNLDFSEENRLNSYIALYNNYYTYREPLDPAQPFTEYRLNNVEDDLADVSSSVKTFVLDTLEDNQCLIEPWNLNNKYVMIYRGQTTYDVNEKYNVNSNEVIEWDDLEKTVGATNFEAIKEEIKQELLQNKISGYTADVLKERIKEADIEIYDPYFEYRFESSYEDEYDLIHPNDFKADLIFSVTYNNKTTDYTVSDFYNKQSTSIGLTTVVDRLKLDYVYQYKDLFLDEDDLEGYEDELKNAINTFNKGNNSSYPKEIGEETFLLASYGYPTYNEVLKYSKVASAVLSAYLSQKVFDEWSTEDHQLNTAALNILENILNTGNANYDSIFSINIDHLLIYIDDNADGTPDDPEQFLKNFTEEEKTNFYDAVLNLMQAVYQEATHSALTASNDIMDILNYIVKAYNRNDTLISDPTKSWQDYKQYNLQLKVESLSSSGDTDQSNVGNYVTEFGDYIKALYQKAVADQLEIEDEKSIFYFKTSGTNQPLKEDICETEFGFHMIVVNSYEDDPENTLYTESEDKYGYGKNFDILLNEKDTDTEDDNIYVTIENIYNDSDPKKATMNQFFTYYVQTQTGATPTLTSEKVQLFNAMFNDAITRYTSSDFQTYLLFKEMNIQAGTGYSLLADQLVHYGSYLENVSRSYEEDETFNAWYDGSLDWSRPYQQ